MTPSPASPRKRSSTGSARPTASSGGCACTSSSPRSSRAAPPFPNSRQSASWTCTGLLAHESAMHGSAIRKLPEWTFS
jgi:hypothetical protein